MQDVSADRWALRLAGQVRAQSQTQTKTWRSSSGRSSGKLTLCAGAQPGLPVSLQVTGTKGYGICSFSQADLRPRSRADTSAIKQDGAPCLIAPWMGGAGLNRVPVYSKAVFAPDFILQTFKGTYLHFQQQTQLGAQGYQFVDKALSLTWL